jgi:uncharacterized PurR-regulated membrane protein YhhQ (DUF165 family)
VRYLALAAYVGCIWGANWAITTFGLVPIPFGLVAPAGVYFAGLSFTARDLLQDTAGRWWTVGGILLGAALSALLSPQLALASGVAFLVSEGLDMAVYTPLRARGHWLGAVGTSNTVGAVVDSALFLWLAFGSLALLPGQVVGKLLMTLPAIAVLGYVQRRRRLREAA